MRPDSVPPSATWCDEDSEWVLGAKNSDGEYEGEVRYWRPDGTLVCIVGMVAGQYDGECRRFHENGEVSLIANYAAGVLEGMRTWLACDAPTTENMHARGMSLEIRRAEIFYEGDRPSRFRCFLADGTEVEHDGSPLGRRPEAVPASALPTKDGWIAGVWNADGQKDGELRHFTEDGTLNCIETCRADVLHGPVTLFYGDGSLRARMQYEDGDLGGMFEHYHRSGCLARRGSITGGAWAGSLEDFDHDGEPLREVTFEAPAPPAGPQPATASEEAYFEELTWPPDEDVSVPARWSAAGLGQLVAIGWGGDEDRDPDRARHARALVREAATNDEALKKGLAEVGLGTAPRLLTAARLERVEAVLAEVSSVDSTTLNWHLVEEGGIGARAALAAGGARALEFLRARLSTKGALSLNRSGLESLPIEVRHLPTISKLDLSHNALRELPAELADLPMLGELRLGDNRIERLPEELTRLRDLRCLYLSGNALRELPAVLTELSELTVLNLSDNALTTLPDEFVRLERLSTLWLSGNALETLPSSFGRLSKLTFLHLGNAPWQEPPPCVWELESLETLWLASPSLRHLPAEVARLGKLERLHLWYSQLEELPDVLFEMTQLKELRIRDNPLPDGTRERLEEALPDCTIY